ncbi:MAG: hypothetical protein ABJD07_11980 [Gemmatimonadaceae bacterium]
MDSMLAEFDHEMATTRTLLERVPAARMAWKPHVPPPEMHGPTAETRR